MSVHELRSVPSDAKGASVGHRVYKPHGMILSTEGLGHPRSSARNILRALSKSPFLLQYDPSACTIQ